MKWQIAAIGGGAVLVLLALFLIIFMVKKRKKKAKQVKKEATAIVKTAEEKPKEVSKVSFDKPAEKPKAAPVIEKYQPEEAKPQETSMEEDDYALYRKEAQGTRELPPSFEDDDFDDNPFQNSDFNNVDPRAFAQRGRFIDPRLQQNAFGSYDQNPYMRQNRPLPDENNDDFDEEFNNFRNQHCYSKFLIDKNLLDQIEGLPDDLKNVVFSDVFKKKDFDDIHFGD